MVELKLKSPGVSYAEFGAETFIQVKEIVSRNS
jgi:hypothetical protein